jgi:MFS family permease
VLINRWGILCVLFVARFALGFQFQSAGSLTPFIVRDFGVDYTAVGTLVGLYMIPGLFLSVPAGYIGRRFGDKRIVLVGLALMLTGGAIAGAANSHAMVVFGRIMSGGGAALLFVLMTKMVTDWFVHKELFLGMSIFIIGWPIGIAAGQAVQATIAAQSSWSFVFHLTAIGCAIAYCAVVVFYRPPPELEETPTDSFLSLSRREFVLVNIAGLVWMFINGAYIVLLSFGPILLLEQGIAFAPASLAVSLMSWVFVLALPLGGYLATRYKMPNVVMFIGLIGATVVGGLIPYTDIPFVTFFLFGLLYAAAAPVVAALPAEVLRPRNRGPGLGIYFIWYYAGSAFLPVVAGYVKDATGTAVASVHFGIAMMIATIVLVGLFRLAQAAIPVRAEAGA